MQVPISTVSAEYIGFVVAFFANLVLVFLIVTQTRHNFGSYKYLMLCFALFSLWYSFIDIITQPTMHAYKNAFIVICSSWFEYNKTIAPIIITTYCTSFGLTVVLLAIHFVYRYIAISRPYDLRFFAWPLCLVWPSIFFGVAIVWWLNVYFLLHRNDVMDDYMRETIWINYHDQIDKLSYIGPLYYKFDPLGNIVFHWPSCTAMSVVYAISSTTLLIIVVLGYQIYQKMHEVQHMLAEKTRELQRQLFYSLLVQTIVPVIFMYTPTTILFLAPVLGIELGSMANMTSICLALYPALDPLVVIVFIRDYRKFVLGKMCFQVPITPTVTMATSTRTIVV